jgi:hypothetical protein
MGITWAAATMITMSSMIVYDLLASIMVEY